MSRYDIAVLGGQVVTPAGVHPLQIGIRDGRIAALVETDESLPAEMVVDATHQHVLPGVVDVHGHLTAARGDLGQAVERHTASMVLGGVTTYLDILHARGSYQPVISEAVTTFTQHALVDVGFHVTLMHDGHVGELGRYAELGVSSFKLYPAAGGRELYPGVFAADDGVLYDALRQIAALGPPALAMVHAENWEIAERLGAQLRAAGRMDLPAWSASRPHICEEETLQRVALLAGEVGCPVYAVHLTSATSVRLLAELRAQGVTIIGETGPHYLTVTQDDERALLAKYAPPVRGVSDMDVLWRGLADGTLDVIASDHIPLSRADKFARGDDIWSAYTGVPGSGTILPVLLSEGVNRRQLSLEKVAEVASLNPARHFGLFPRKGAIMVGADADLVLVDLQREVVVTPEMLGVDFTLFDGRRFQGWPTLTLLRGHVVAQNGVVVASPGQSQYLARPLQAATRVATNERSTR